MTLDIAFFTPVDLLLNGSLISCFNLINILGHLLAFVTCSVEQIIDIGAKWVILGHSERRHIIGENDEVKIFKDNFCSRFLRKIISVFGERCTIVKKLTKTLPTTVYWKESCLCFEPGCWSDSMHWRTITREGSW